jgi:hypothetical protein
MTENYIDGHRFETIGVTLKSEMEEHKYKMDLVDEVYQSFLPLYSYNGQAALLKRFEFLIKEMMWVTIDAYNAYHTGNERNLLGRVYK